MRLARYENVVAFPSADGGAVALHAENLQVARLDAQAWQALAEPAAADDEARAEILTWNREIDPRAHDGVDGADVRYLSINVAQICNLKCTYCAAGGDGTFGEAQKQIDLTKAYAQLEFFLKPLPNGARFVLNFLGGEPLVAPQAIEAIIGRALLLTAGRGIEITHKITTNGTLITPAIAEMLARHRFHVQISLDGPPEINDVSRPTASGRGSTEMALRGARELFARSDRLGSISTSAVHGAHNLDAVATYEFLREFPWDRISLAFDSECRDPEMSRRFAESLGEVGERAWALGGERELRRVREFEVAFEALDAQRRSRNFCGAGKSQLLMDAAGKLYACYWWAGDKSEELSGPDGRLDKDRLQSYSASHVDAHDCRSCWARNLCGGGCMHINKRNAGEKHRKDAVFCERTRAIIAKGVELYERARRDEQSL